MTNKIMELADEYAECVKNYTMLHPLREQAHAALQAEVERVASVPMKYKRMEFNAELQQRIAELEAECERLKDKLDSSVHGHNQIFDLCKVLETERDALRIKVDNQADNHADVLMSLNRREQYIEKLEAALKQERDAYDETTRAFYKEELKLRDDAKRFRWLRNHTVQTGLSLWMHEEQFLSEAVDAAMKETP